MQSIDSRSFLSSVLPRYKLYKLSTGLIQVGDEGLPRSLFFSYEPRAEDILARARSRVSIDLGRWRSGIRSGKLSEVLCPKTLGTWPIKFYAAALVDALTPDLRLVRIDEKTFVDFLKQQKAEENSWTMRFWEIDQKKGWSRAITAGKEVPDVWSEIRDAMTRVGRRTEWAGVEFTHPKFQSRVLMHRYPTASISPWGEGGSSYNKVKDEFVSLLRRIV